MVKSVGKLVKTNQSAVVQSGVVLIVLVQSRRAAKINFKPIDRQLRKRAVGKHLFSRPADSTYFDCWRTNVLIVVLVAVKREPCALLVHCAKMLAGAQIGDTMLAPMHTIVNMVFKCI